MKDNPEVAYDLLRYRQEVLKSDTFYDMFVPVYSPAGSNARENKETAVYQFANYLQSISGTYKCNVI